MNKTQYHLMHGNISVAEIEVDGLTGKITNINKILEPLHLPVSNNGTITTTALSKWWNRRAVPITRKGIRPILDSIGLNNVESLLLKNLGLSITDHYWVKPFDMEITWDGINLYQNDFDDIIGTYQFTGSNESLSEINQIIPGASTQGELPKKWIKKDNNIYLIKGNSGTGFQQSLNEVFASTIHKKQNLVSYVEYGLVDYKTDSSSKTGCICKNFTSNDIEFVPAIDICSSGKKTNDMSEYDYFILQCNEHGLDKSKVKTFVNYQIATDFLITNTDRHFNNFGVLRDVNTMKFVSMAPIFDSGNSMYWDQNILSDYSLLNISTSSFSSKEHLLLKNIRGEHIIDLNKLPSMKEIKKLYALDMNASEKRIDMLANIFVAKCEMLEMNQRGYDFTKTAYEFRNKSFLCENVKVMNKQLIQ